MTEGPYQLPDGWRWVSLGEVCRYDRRTVDPRRFPERTFYLYSIPAYDEGQTPEKFDGGHIGSSKLIISPGVCLFSKLNPRIPRAWVVPEVPEGGVAVASTEFMPLRPISKTLDLNYLGKLLVAAPFLSQVQQAVTGATGSRQRLNPEAILQALIPLPPLEEQRRIVARINELMERVREAKRLRQQAKQDAERIMQAALAEVFPRPGTELPADWRWVRLGEVCETKMGGTPSTKVAEYWEPGEVIWVTPEDLEKSQLNRVYSSRRLISRLGLERSSAKLFPQNTVLLSTTATIGKVGIAETTLSANQQISGIICGKDINSEFLAYYLLQLGETALKHLGGTATATHINQANLRSLLIPLPPLDEQRRIVTYLDAIQEKVKSLKAAQDATDAAFQCMEQSILDKAFRGEL